MWEFPGGKPHAGESDKAALVREVREETGMEIVPKRLYHEVTHSYPERVVNLKFYLCEQLPNSPEPQTLEVAEVLWADSELLKSLEFPEANKPLVEMLVASPISISR